MTRFPPSFPSKSPDTALWEWEEGNALTGRREGRARPGPSGRSRKRLPLQIGLRSQENGWEQIQTARNSARLGDSALVDSSVNRFSP